MNIFHSGADVSSMSGSGRRSVRNFADTTRRNGARTGSTIHPAAGGRTGLTSVVVAACFVVSAFFAGVVSAVPLAATSPVLVIVGILMVASFADVAWRDVEVAAPCFFTAVFMALCYNISYGIAAGFIVYCLIRIYKGEMRQVHPLMWIFTGLFVLNFVMLALI